MKWPRIWQLSFNKSKCRFLDLGKNNPNHKYTLINNKNEKELIEVAEEKDLGVKFDNQLNFKHIF